MQFLKSALAAATALVAVQAHAGYTFEFDTPAPAGSYRAPAFVDGFQASTQYASVLNAYLQPTGDNGSFLVVTSKPSGLEGHARINTGDVQAYSFLWGSPDAYNFVDIYGASGFETTFSGSRLSDTPMTGLFTIFANGGSVIDHLVLRSDGAAFEVAAAVPEPETYALMFAGIGAIGLMSRGRNRR